MIVSYIDHRRLRIVNMTNSIPVSFYLSLNWSMFKTQDTFMVLIGLNQRIALRALFSENQLKDRRKLALNTAQTEVE